MIPQHEQKRIRREAKLFARLPQTNNPSITIISKDYSLSGLAGYEAGATAEYLRYKPVVEALRALVALKEYKYANGKDTYYNHEQPFAWEEADNALKQLNQ